MMIYVLVLCGLALEAFRLSIAAGAIQANLTKRKIILLGGMIFLLEFSQQYNLFCFCWEWYACGSGRISSQFLETWII